MPREQDREYLETIPDDEPVFILRAKDEFATTIVNRWISMAMDRKVNDEKVENAAIQHFGAMLDWRKKNPDKVKTPD